MADGHMIARLADLREFAELGKHIDAAEEGAVERLARKTYALPAEHDTLEWEKLKAFYAGARSVLELPHKLRDAERKETQ